MKKIFLGLAVLVAATSASAQMNMCLGFASAASLVCEENGKTYNIEIPDEKGCGVGRDGVADGVFLLKNLGGPSTFDLKTWTIDFDGADGQRVEFKTCKEVNR